MDTIGEATPRPQLGARRLLQFASDLQHATSFGDLLAIAEREVRRAVGYEHAWFMVAEDEKVSSLRLLEISHGVSDRVWSVAPILKVEGDAFLEELTHSCSPVIVEDARTDPRTNKQVVGLLSNRTLVNIPLRLVDKPLGLFGVGTFGDEGCRAPSEEELEYLVGMANQLAVAASRIRLHEMEQLARKRQEELDRQLVQAQKLESLGLLAGGVAHDFNNLLTVIIASASLANETARDGEVRSELRSVLAAAGRAKELTSQLLTLSRSQPLDVQSIDLAEQLSRVVELSRRLLPESISVELDVPPVPLATQGDPSQFDQVLLNLLINARDAMPRGGVIRIRLERQVVAERREGCPEAGGYAVISVKDCGLGMSDEVRRRVFEPFFTTKGPTKGTGLGLAVSYGIVQQHGGKIRCESELGAGTTFFLYFPQTLPGVARKCAPSAAHPTVGHEHIVVVEDDPLLRKVTGRLLRQAGYEVTPLPNGTAACEYVRLHSADLVLMDIMMPGMPCADIVANVLRHHNDLPIVLTSGYSADVNIRELVQCVDNPLLRKPYTPEDLFRSVRDAIDRAKARRQQKQPISLVPMAG